MYFPAAGIEVNPFYPFITAFTVSMFCSIGGISGAFLLLPWQMSVLGYTAPGVSATNQIFNIIGCPGGIWRYAREGRLLLPLSLFIAAGTLPGVFGGAFLRLTVLNSQSVFLPFAAIILFYLGVKLLKTKSGKTRTAEKAVLLSCSRHGFSFRYSDGVHDVPARPLVLLSLAIGLAGGIYGVGGGAIMVPFLVSFFRLPVHAIAGAALLATFLTSVAGAVFYTLLAFFWNYPQGSPDWPLGIILGLGGLAGMYSGAAAQKFIPAHIIRIFLAGIVFGIGSVYFYQIFDQLF